MESSSTSAQVYPVIWQGDHVLLINQTRLPREYGFVEVKRCNDMIEAIHLNIVQGDTAKSLATVYALYMGVRDIETSERDSILLQIETLVENLISACSGSPTVKTVLNRMVTMAKQATGGLESLKKTMLATAQSIHAETLERYRAIGQYGVQQLPAEPSQLRILTHGSNVGSLVAGGYGTALAIARFAHRQGRLTQIYVTETRPTFEGSRFTAWECMQEGIPVTVIPDSAAALCLQQGVVDVIIAGAEKIAANGDVMNHIGTYALAIAAKVHNIPFWVAAPTSVIDYNLRDGSQMAIAERKAETLTQFDGTILAMGGTAVYNPASDITPAELITAIVTEHGAGSPHDLSRLKD